MMDKQGTNQKIDLPQIRKDISNWNTLLLNPSKKNHVYNCLKNIGGIYIKEIEYLTWEKKYLENKKLSLHLYLALKEEQTQPYIVLIDSETDSQLITNEDYIITIKNTLSFKDVEDLSLFKISHRLNIIEAFERVIRWINNSKNWIDNKMCDDKVFRGFVIPYGDLYNLKGGDIFNFLGFKDGLENILMEPEIILIANVTNAENVNHGNIFEAYDLTRPVPPYKPEGDFQLIMEAIKST